MVINGVSLIYIIITALLDARKYYTDIDRDGHEISRFGGLPRELYFPKGKYNYLGIIDT